MRISLAYKILGIEAGASDADVRAAYVALVKKYHPDTVPPIEGYEEKLKQINAAYTLLKNENLRRRYEGQLNKARRGRFRIAATRGLPRQRIAIGSAAAVIAVAAGIWVVFRAFDSAPELPVSASAPTYPDAGQRAGPGKQDALRGPLSVAQEPASTRAVEEQRVDQEKYSRNLTRRFQPPRGKVSHHPAKIALPANVRLTQLKPEKIEPLPTRPAKTAAPRDVASGIVSSPGDVLAGGF